MTLLSQVVGFAALAIAARRLGPGELGAANFALGVAIYFGIPANFGITIMGIRDIAREPERAREIAGEVLAIRLGLGLVLAAAMVALSPVLTPAGSPHDLLPIAALTILAGSVGAEWVLLGQQRMTWVGLGRLGGQLAYAAGVLIFLHGGGHGAALFCWLTLLSIALTVVIQQTAVMREIGVAHLVAVLPRLRRRLVAALPFGIAVVAVQLYISLDSIMLGYLASVHAVGEYTVAYKIPLALYGVLNLWSASVYPQAARLVGEASGTLRAQVDTFTTICIGVALPLGAGATILGSDLIPLLFGSRYHPAATPFVLLMWSLSVALVTVNFGAALAAGGDERRYAVGVSLSAVLNLLINLWAIPAHGTIGAASATLVCELALVVYMIHRYHQVVGPVRLDVARLVRLLGATAVMCAVLVAVPGSVPVLARVAGGAVLFVLSAVALGAIRRDDLPARWSGRA